MSALTETTQHVILIGDHQQLRPTVNEYNLAQKHNLEVSMFERLINSGFPHVTLTTQRRMHPEISSLITPSIYQKLEDADSVRRHPPVRGIKERLFFFNHSHLEDSEMGKQSSIVQKSEAAHQNGRSNMFEAKMLLGLVQHLLLNGYSASQIVVLSMYKQQLRLLRTLAKGDFPGSKLLNEKISDVRITTTDNYQGEECEVVLISLVRSNAEEKIGFVGVANRVCVALSRAREGLYVIGNFDMMRKKNVLWETICSTVEQREQIGNELCLVCPNHPDGAVNMVQKAEDFARSPYGGCLRPCGGTFRKCGHKCKLVCHARPHEDICCPSVCEAPREIGCTHPCPQPCGQVCLPCAVIVPKERSSCGHTLNVKCSEDVEDVPCRKPCPVSMICGHKCPEECSHRHPASYLCMEPCTKPRLSCLHPCVKRCSEPCGPCVEKVTRTLPCGHSVEMLCSQDVTKLKCKEKCPRTLPGCSHACPRICHAGPCEDICQVIVQKRQPLCQKSSAPHEAKSKCGEPLRQVPCPDKCGARMPCGHLCSSKCGVCMPTGADVALHAECKAKCSRVLPCNHKCESSHTCGTVCPPCEKPCQEECIHKRCTSACGAPCEPCMAEASSCGHVDCSQLRCFESPYDLKTTMFGTPLYCNIPCPKSLNCGHSCLGLCGERCPPLCNSCSAGKANKSKKALLDTSIAQQRSKEWFANARLIVLPCLHSFEVESLDAHVLQQASLSFYPRCPFENCKATIRGVNRYKNIMRRSIKRLQPPYFALREESFRADFEKDMKLRNYQAIVDGMTLNLGKPVEPNQAAIEHPFFEMALGTALMHDGKVSEANLHLQNGLDTATTTKLQAECAYALGTLFMRHSKRLDKAVSFFERALALNGPNPQTNALLLEARQKLRDETERLEQLARDSIAKRQGSAIVPSSSTAAAEDLPQNADEIAARKAAAKENRRKQEAEDAQELRRSGGTVLHLAVLRGRTSAIQDHLKTDKTLVNMQDNLGNTRKSKRLSFD